MLKTLIRCLLAIALMATLAANSAWAQVSDAANAAPAAAAASAPDPTGYGQVLNSAMQNMDKLLKLTPEQKPKADAIMQGAVNQRLVVFSQYGVKRGQRPSIPTLLSIRSKMTAISSEAHAKMAHVLNPQQLQVFTTQTEQSGEQIKAMLLGN